MRTHRVLLTCVAVLGCTTRGRDAVSVADADARAAQIDRALPTLRHTGRTVEGFSTEGASIDAADEGAQLRRLEATYLGEMGRARETYYFDSTLFYVVRSDARYDAMLSGRITDSTTTRFDLRAAGTPPPRVDSLTARARELLAALASATSLTSCLPYEPDTVQLAGTLERRTFAGAPSYGEDSTHDEQETGFYLRLATPVCADRGAPAAAVRTPSPVTLVQLVLDAAEYRMLRPFLGRAITIRGTLRPAETGHHHAPLLLDPVPPVPAEPAPKAPPEP